MDMDISMDIHVKSVDVDMDMDMKIHIHGNPVTMRQDVLVSNCRNPKIWPRERVMTGHPIIFS